MAYFKIHLLGSLTWFMGIGLGCTAFISMFENKNKSFYAGYVHRHKSSIYCSDGESYDPSQINVLGTPLRTCCCDVGRSGIATGFYRNGYCNTVQEDKGVHGMCTVCDADFLTFSKLINNDLSTPCPELSFPGLVPGDKWCVCVDRWMQAHKIGFAPKIYLQGCHEQVLNYISIDTLMEYAIDIEESREIRQRLNRQKNIVENLMNLPLQGVFE